MPYAGERANPLGFQELLSDPFVKQRLSTYSFVGEGGEEEDLEQLPVRSASELPRSHSPERVTRLWAVDGSVATTETLGRGFQLGAFKVSAVLEDRSALRALPPSGVVDPRAVHGSFQAHKLVALLPGRGVHHRSDEEGRTWHDKFRLEVFANYRAMRTPKIDGLSYSLLECLQLLLPCDTVECPTCRAGEGSGPAVTFEAGDEGAKRCPKCGHGVYMTDVLYDDSQLSFLENQKLFASFMNVTERLMTAGMVEASGRSPRKLLESTAFITDGALALFTGHRELPLALRSHLQKWGKQRPLIFGIEKTGTANLLSTLPTVDKLLTPGSFVMVSSGLADALAGGGRRARGKSRGEGYYGKRFLYRTASGLKTFVVVVPPASGGPYESFNIKCDDWGNYPTLGSVADVLEEEQSDQFSATVAALSAVAEANFQASLPKTQGELALEQLASEAARR